MLPNRSQSLATTNTYGAGEMSALLGKAASATIEDLRLAANVLQEVLTLHEIPFAFMGGFSMILRGSQRITQDIDVAVGGTQRQLRDALAQEWRFILPAGPTSGTTRVFVNIAPTKDDRQVLVSADLIMGGTLGLPEQPEAHSEELSVETSLGTRLYRVIDLPTLVSTKLTAFAARDSPSDLSDLLFLASGNKEQIYGFSQALNPQRRQGFMNALVREGLAPNEIKKMKWLFHMP